MTFLLSSLLGFTLAFGWEYFCANVIKKTSLLLFGWRLHHSLYGIFFIAFGLITQTIFLIGLGIGILIQHTITDGFRFISKEK